VRAALVPSVAQFAIDAFSWRVAYLGFAAAVFALALPMAFFLFKETPDELGLLPDGDRPSDKNARDYPVMQSGTTGLSGREAALTSTYWLILVSFLLVGVGLTSVLAHLVPMLVDRGVSPQTAALCMTSLGLGIIFGRIFAGYLMDYFFAPYVTAFFLLGMVCGIVILATGTSSVLVFVAAVCVGMASGSEISEIAYICSRYFGQKSFGQIYGIMFAAFQIGAAFGAPLMGFYHDRAGDYIGALWFMAGIVLLGAMLIANLKPYPDLQQSDV